MTSKDQHLKVFADAVHSVMQMSIWSQQSSTWEATLSNRSLSLIDTPHRLTWHFCNSQPYLTCWALSPGIMLTPLNLSCTCFTGDCRHAKPLTTISRHRCLPHDFKGHYLHLILSCRWSKKELTMLIKSCSLQEGQIEIWMQNTPHPVELKSSSAPFNKVQSGLAIQHRMCKCDFDS